MDAAKASEEKARTKKKDKEKEKSQTQSGGERRKDPHSTKITPVGYKNCDAIKRA